MNYRLYIFAFAAALMAFAGCEDNTGEQKGTPAVLAIQNAGGEPEVISLLEPKSKTVSLRAVASSVSSENLTISFKVDRALLDAYNAAHGTSYELVPPEAYEFSKKEVILPRYNDVSSTAEIKFMSEQMPDDQVYMLPITFDEVKGEEGTQFSETGNVYYVLFSKRELPPAVLLDRDDWVLVHGPGTKANYEPEKMLDGNPSTFAYCNSDEDNAFPPYHIVIDLGKEVMVRGIEFTHRTEAANGITYQRYGVSHAAIATALTITGDGTVNEADWTYTEDWPSSALPIEVVITPYLEVPQWARYIRVTVYSSYKRYTQNFAPDFKGWCIAELNVLGNYEKIDLD